MPRLFVALEFPDRVRDTISEICGGLPGADWEMPEQFHLTLRFIGEVEKEVFHIVQESLGSLVSQSFYLTLRGLGVFPLRGQPEALWIGVEKSHELLSLRHKVESNLVKNGLPPETRKFYPHVTIAKVKNSKESWLGEYIAGHSLFSIPEIPIQRFNLYSSRLTPEGSLHHEEGVYPLKGILELEG